MKKLIGLFLFAICAHSAQAQISYDYVAATYERTSIDIGFRDIDGNGINVGGSFSIRPNVFGFADFNFASFDADVDVNSYSVGVGYHTLGPTQYVAKAAVSRVNVDTGLNDGRDNGYSIELGGRGRVGERYELEGFVQYLDSGGDDSGEFGVKGTVRYHFQDQLSTDLFVALADDVTTVGLGFRVEFSR